MDTRHVCAPSAVHLTWTGQSPAQPAKQHEHQLLEQIALEDSSKDRQALLARQRQRNGGNETSENNIRSSQMASFNCVLSHLENNLYIQTNKTIVCLDIAVIKQG